MYELDKANRSLQLELRAIYLAFLSDPCNNEEYLKRATQEVINNENLLRLVSFKIEQIKSLREKGVPEKGLERYLNHAQKKILGPDNKKEILGIFKKTKRDFNKWKRE